MKESMPSLYQMLNQIQSLTNHSPSPISHSYNVSQMANSFGAYLGLCNKDINKLIIGGLLHDIGKVSYDDDLLSGIETLDEEKRGVIHNHTIVGLSIVNHHIVDKEIREIILYHHERVDGKGYPFGLIGNEIPKLVKIISIVDAYDAMTSSRGYNEKLTKEQAIQEIIHCAGSQFDEDLAHSFIGYLNKNQPSRFHFLS